MYVVTFEKLSKTRERVARRREKSRFFTFTEKRAEEFACVRSTTYPRSCANLVQIRQRNANATQQYDSQSDHNAVQSFSNLRDREIVRFLLYSPFVLTTISRVINFRDLARANRRDYDELSRTMRDNDRYCYEDRR